MRARQGRLQATDQAPTLPAPDQGDVMMQQVLEQLAEIKRKVEEVRVEAAEREQKWERRLDAAQMLDPEAHQGDTERVPSPARGGQLRGRFTRFTRFTNISTPEPQLDNQVDQTLARGGAKQKDEAVLDRTNPLASCLQWARPRKGMIGPLQGKKKAILTSIT
ncbi:hypothetical protein CBOM_00003 [Ceraceosorus bombacis]|uniref:Uncharacterized protein n=1 Tax=Ceraceosorus bombacis TaxID=401625 RepID=A0A0P1B8A0_9BASI|nr:hypothetical protein CBOM_00003 [Ceraceosorus bombacis]